MRKIFSDNKEADIINLPRVLHDWSVSSTLDIPTVVYGMFEPCIHPKTINFKKFVSNLQSVS